ncbi:hypothetical protein FRB94_009561 [Tulasnella sp. JGI-2019a]|nr:hypothetical protein FRB94_009561 [Tulasnella sp. JGI-2019a]
MFADITPADKEAFFLLLDEYFASRGSIAAIAAGKSPGGQAAMKNIGSTAGAHLKARTGFGGPNMFGGSSTTNAPAASSSSPASQETVADESSKPSFASLRGAFASATPMATSMLGGSKKAPPPPPPSVKYQSRPPITQGVAVPQAEEEEAEEEEPATSKPTPPAAPLRPSPSIGGKFAPSSLVSGKHFGSGKIDLTSKSTMVSSAFGNLRNRGAPAAPVPTSPTSATPPPPARSFAPPPIRRVPSSAPPVRTPEPEPELEPEPEPEQEGEWAEALYDYTSGDKTDLHFVEGQRIRIVEHTSDDWWTGELDGKEGLFPATYVKIL